MFENMEPLGFGAKIKEFVRKRFSKLTNADLRDNFSVKTVTPSKEQEELLKSHGEICDAIGSKLVVVRNDDGCMLFKLTEENGIEQVDLVNVGFKVKNISRVFKELFIMEGESNVEIVRFNPDTDKKGESLGIFKGYQKGWKDPLDRNNRGVTCFRDGESPKTFYANKYKGDIPNFKLVKNNDENVVNNNKGIADGGFCDEI